MKFFRRAGQPKSHIGAGGGQHHVFGIEFHALHRVEVITSEHTNLMAGIGVPDMHSTITAAGEYELRIWTNAGLNGNALVIRIADEHWQRNPMKGIDRTYNRAIGTKQYGCAISRKL